MTNKQIYNNPKTIKFSNEQINTLKILESYNVNISYFIREAVKEKIKRDWKQIKESNKKSECPF